MTGMYPQRPAQRAGEYRQSGKHNDHAGCSMSARPSSTTRQHLAGLALRQ